LLAEDLYGLDISTLRFFSFLDIVSSREIILRSYTIAVYLFYLRVHDFTITLKLSLSCPRDW
jgi:hypothetical protein